MKSRSICYRLVFIFDFQTLPTRVWDLDVPSARALPPRQRATQKNQSKSGTVIFGVLPPPRSVFTLSAATISRRCSSKNSTLIGTSRSLVYHPARSATIARPNSPLEVRPARLSSALPLGVTGLSPSIAFSFGGSAWGASPHPICWKVQPHKLRQWMQAGIKLILLFFKNSSDQVGFRCSTPRLSSSMLSSTSYD
jgi:hypothetical protein